MMRIAFVTKSLASPLLLVFFLLVVQVVDARQGLVNYSAALPASGAPARE